MSTPATTVGDWVAPTADRITSVDLDLRPLDLIVHWKRCGQVADWLGAFLQYEFEKEARPLAAELLSVVTNELVENAVKFAADKEERVRLSARHDSGRLVLETRNLADAARAKALRDALEALESEDLEELFRRRIEREDESGSSGLGLLILKRDYGARLALRLAPRGPERWEVTVQVALDIEEIGR